MTPKDYKISYVLNYLWKLVHQYLETQNLVAPQSFFCNIIICRKAFSTSAQILYIDASKFQKQSSLIFFPANFLLLLPPFACLKLNDNEG